MHKEKTTDGTRILPLSRRSFGQVLAVGGATAGPDWCRSPVNLAQNQLQFRHTCHRRSAQTTYAYYLLRDCCRSVL
jgi:hypothetical protein